MTYYVRDLPHWHPSGRPLFITWRLHGSLSQAGTKHAAPLNNEESGRRFRLMDAALDRAQCGPVWLKDERVANAVARCIHHADNALGFYELHAFVVMANHVHLLITPKVTLARIMNGLKGVTAREANVILGRVGRAFWQAESFDHWVRNAAEFERVRKYIEGNPVAAGLAGRAEEWRWSSVFRDGV